MNIEIKTTFKKITKSIIKQMDVTKWSDIERQLKESPETDFFRVSDVFKFDVVIFKSFNNEWCYFPLHEYTISAKGDDVYINRSKHCFINNKNKAELFIENVDLIKRRMIKIFI